VNHSPFSRTLQSVESSAPRHPTTPARHTRRFFLFCCCCAARSCPPFPLAPATPLGTQSTVRIATSFQSSCLSCVCTSTGRAQLGTQLTADPDRCPSAKPYPSAPPLASLSSPHLLRELHPACHSTTTLRFPTSTSRDAASSRSAGKAALDSTGYLQGKAEDARLRLSVSGTCPSSFLHCPGRRGSRNGAVPARRPMRDAAGWRVSVHSLTEIDGWWGRGA